MKNYRTNEAEFKTEIQIPEPTDPAHADVINTPIKQVFGNTVANKENIEQTKQNVDKQLADFKAEISAEQDSLNKTLKETIGNSINGIDGKVTEILNKLIALENAIYYDITGNSWRLSFTNLEGAKVTKGNYNSTKKRIEC